jgi:hypothetical protein
LSPADFAILQGQLQLLEDNFKSSAKTVDTGALAPPLLVASQLSSARLADATMQSLLQ